MGRAAFALLMAAGAAPVVAQPACHDALVIAEVAHGVPLLPDCGGCLWTGGVWIVELQVSRVVDGRAVAGPVTALTVQPDRLARDTRLRGARGWLLRANSLGGYNAEIADATQTRQCRRGLAAVPALAAPEGGGGMAGLLREARAASGAHYGF